jgi:hypothetical protein
MLNKGQQDQERSVYSRLKYIRLLANGTVACYFLWLAWQRKHAAVIFIAAVVSFATINSLLWFAGTRDSAYMR